jgi:glycogen debranching enzyme
LTIASNETLDLQFTPHPIQPGLDSFFRARLHRTHREILFESFSTTSPLHSPPYSLNVDNPMIRTSLLLLLIAVQLHAAAIERSRATRTWEFVDAVGEQSSILGQEDGSLDAYVYPLKIFADLRFSFEVGGRVIPAEAISRRVSFYAGSAAITYTGDEFQVVETLVAPVHEAGGIIRLDVMAHDPLTIRFSLRRDFQLIWPASIGSAYGQWHPDLKLFVFGADGSPYSAVLGGTDISVDSIDYATNYSAQSRANFTLGTVKGRVSRTLAFGGSMKSFDEARQIETRLLQNADRLQAETDEYYQQYLRQTVSVHLPDKDLQEAYDWSRLSLAKGIVENPFLGTGLVAGYGPSKGTYRPGFAWFFGRDSFWSSFALNSEGDWKNSRTAIEFIARFQRDDGKIPHEISQSANQVAWSKDFPYEYASADATPLFIIAIRDYVQHSGDKTFASAIWERANKALAFSRSTFDAEGFPKNVGVGHGWVEGGPLLPVRVEFYMAGCYVEAVRSLAQLAAWTGHNSEANGLQKEADEKQKKLNKLFWLNSSGNYAFAIGTDGKTVDEPSVLATVPEWWSLLDLAHAQRMTEHLADESHASDWGMRIISSKAQLYSPAGYHFGSVWPLFTGWASVGEYHAHESAAALANLKANSWLALDGASGNTTEVLSGESYSPLSTASPHQIWSAAMVISPLLRGLFGLEVDSIENTISLTPHIPADWTSASLHAVRLGNGYVDFTFTRTSDSLLLKIDNHNAGDFKLRFAPAYSPYSAVTEVRVADRVQKYSRQENATDWHPVIETAVPASGTSVAIAHTGFFGLTFPNDPPRLADTSSNIKLISEKWQPRNKQLVVHVSGLANRAYAIECTGSQFIQSVAGAERDGSRLKVTMPPGHGYVDANVQLTLK